MDNKGMQQLSDLFNGHKTKKPPAYRWQDLALWVIQELKIPNFKRSAVFKACKDHPPQFIKNAVNDTKELCRSGQKWKYFFKIIANKNTEPQQKP